MFDKRKLLAASALAALLLAAPARAQVAGFISLAVNMETMIAVTEGYSVQRSILRRVVYNEEEERVGTIDDLIIDPQGNTSFVIIGAGRFVGSARHDVAVQVGHLVNANGKFVLNGATAEAIRAMPQFEYPQ